jgi:H+/Cl- antiporter ClcA/CBS domain-containing protein
VAWSLRVRARSVSARIAQEIGTTTYLRKWLILGGGIGLIAGCGAVVFYEALTFATHVFLGLLVAYRVPTPIGEGYSVGSATYGRAWALPLVVGLGGLLSGLLVFRFAPEAEGHGTDAAIDAVHHNPRGIRVRAVLVKIVASALTIGSGGSGGREGPTAQISAGFGSLLARVLNLSPADGRIAVSVGIGSGIGAIFGAPLGGAVLAAEIIYRDDFEVEALLPAIIASTFAYAVFGVVEGFNPLFGYVDRYRFSDPMQLGWFAVIGVIGGIVGLLYARGFYGMVDLFKRLPVARALRPAIAGLMVGLMALVMPQVLGTGYGWVQQGLGRATLLAIPLWIVLALPLARILATALSIGSGGSGGIFGPGMVIGAFVGAAVWRIAEPIAPGVPHDPAAFVVVGMMACFGGISRAPLAVMLMVAEMTGSLEIAAPAMLAVGLSTLIVRRSDDTIYRSQVRARNDSPGHRLQFGMPLLANVSVTQVMSAPRVLLEADTTVADALRMLETRSLPGGPVVDHHGIFIGTVGAAQLAELGEGRAGDPVERVVDVTAPSVQANAALDVALEALTNAGGSWVTALDSGRHVVGIVTSGRIVAGYRQALEANLNRLSTMAGGVVPLELRVAAAAPVAGLTVRAAGLPRGTIVVTIERGKSLLFGAGDSVFEPGDMVSMLARPGARSAIEEMFSGAEREDEGDDGTGAMGVPGTDGGDQGGSGNG